MSLHVVLLGWHAVEQRRIDFVRHLRAHTGMILTEALELLNRSCDLDCLPLVVVTTDDRDDALSLCRAILACGCEARLIAAHDPSEVISCLRTELRAAHDAAPLGRGSLAEPIRRLREDLRPT